MDLKRTVKFEADRDPEFARWVSHTVGGERIRHCLQCGLCSGKCPLSLYMDYTPRRLMHLSREGFKEEVLGSSSIWLCTACYACMVNCPKKINVTHLLYALKRRAIEEGRYPRRFAIPVMAKQFSRWCVVPGALPRVGLSYGSFCARALATAGNEQAWPEVVSCRPHATEEGESSTSTGDRKAAGFGCGHEKGIGIMRYAYYPGCSLRGTGRSYEESLLAVFRALMSSSMRLTTGTAAERLPTCQWTS